MTTNIPLITSVPKLRLGIPNNDSSVAGKNQFYVSEQSLDFILENPKEFHIAPLKGAVDLCNYVNSKIQVKHMLELNCFQGELSSIFAFKLNPNVLNVVSLLITSFSGLGANRSTTFKTFGFNLKAKILESSP